MDDAAPAPGAHRSGPRHLLPGGNLPGLVYGTLTAGALLAAEAGRHETVGDLTEAVAVATALYWLAHAYASALGQRLRRADALHLVDVVGALRHESSLLVGGAVPLAVLLVTNGAGAGIEAAGTAGIIAAAALLVVLEVVAGARAGLRGIRLAAQVPIGALMGVGIYALKIILH